MRNIQSSKTEFSTEGEWYARRETPEHLSQRRTLGRASRRQKRQLAQAGKTPLASTNFWYMIPSIKFWQEIMFEGKGKGQVSGASSTQKHQPKQGRDNWLQQISGTKSRQNWVWIRWTNRRRVLVRGGKTQSGEVEENLVHEILTMNWICSRYAKREILGKITTLVGGEETRL